MRILAIAVGKSRGVAHLLCNLCRVAAEIRLAMLAYHGLGRNAGSAHDHRRLQIFDLLVAFLVDHRLTLRLNLLDFFTGSFVSAIADFLAGYVLRHIHVASGYLDRALITVAAVGDIAQHGHGVRLRTNRFPGAPVTGLLGIDDFAIAAPVCRFRGIAITLDLADLGGLRRHGRHAGHLHFHGDFPEFVRPLCIYGDGSAAKRGENNGGGQCFHLAASRTKKLRRFLHIRARLRIDLYVIR